MADIQSALHSVYEPGRKGAGAGEAQISIKEITGRDIVQFAAWPDTVEAAAKKAAKTVGHALPGDTFTAASKGKTSVFRIAPEKFLIVCPLRAGMGAAGVPVTAICAICWPTRNAVVSKSDAVICLPLPVA